ncbi:MAG TPA: M1 family metallopeptidase [Bryobacteraceae bacterium]|jgi:alanyl aminopeptidase
MKFRSRRWFVWLLLLSASLDSAGWCASGPPKLRLGEVQQVKPESYTVELTLNPDRDDFSEVVGIHVNVEQAIPTLWLNATNIAVQKASVAYRGEQRSATVVPGGDDFLGLKFEAPIPPGPAQVRIEYTGKFMLSDQSGIFRTEDRGNRYLLTQFEQTDARRAFPCFDEPVYKVPWQVTLHVPAQDSALSNTPASSEKNEGGTKTYVFQQTKPLPSYLVAFGVGPFEFVNAGFAGRNHVPVRIVTAKGRANEAKYAAEVTATILTKLEDYFGVPYPYAKADQVAIPISASFAMENAGMVTYGQTIILAKPETDTEERRRGYASVAAHELAHQWFGDLVTTAWWNDIWLNEAFASWMSSKLIAEWKPDWETRAGDVDQKLFAENSDSLLSARKITQEIESKGDIPNAFDSITYLKGSAVIGMFENWLGEKNFQKGVQSYMNRYAFRTATTGDFLDSLSTASQKNVTAAFSTFLNQSGVPIVSVALDCNAGSASLQLKQQRYLPLGSKSTGNQRWQTPVCIRYSTSAGEQSSCALMTDSEMNIPLQTNSCPGWVQANDKAVGYYRLDYAGGLLEKLMDGDVMTRLSAAERVDLIGNARALAQSGRMPMSDALALVPLVHSDPERHVVEEALGLAMSPREHLVASELLPKYAEFIRANFQARAHELGWTPKPDERAESKLLRPDLVSAVATDGQDQALAKEAESLTNNWLNTDKGIDPSMLSSVLSAAAYYQGADLADRFIGAWAKLDAQQQQSLLIAMFGFRDPKAVKTLLGAVLSGKLPVTPASYLFFYAGQGSAESRGVRFQFLKANYDAILKLFGNNPFAGKPQLPRVGGGFCDAQAKGELKGYFDPRLPELTGAARTLANVLEEIDQCVAIKDRQEPSVRAFLQKQ